MVKKIEKRKLEKIRRVNMNPVMFLEFLRKVEKLKSNTRHSVTADGVAESVAAHSWRITLMAYLLKNECKDIDMQKVMAMCLIHDIGEAVTGDIASFNKTEEHEEIEKKAIRQLLLELPEDVGTEMAQLFDEMDALETKEAKFFKALDRMEAVVQHNEADISSWIPVEYEYQMTYGEEDAKEFPVLDGIRKQMKEDTKKKIERETSNK